MDMSSVKVFDFLISKGVKKLYHANTVLTSCSFLQRGSLLSRGNVERGKLFQTSQMSDTLDKKYGVWFDVFLDSVDIHKRSSSKNIYGPVMFVLDIEQLRKQLTGKIWVSRSNPTKWASLGRDERWFSSINQLEEKYIYGDFGQMILFRHCGGELLLKSCLTEIVLDDPFVEFPDSKVDFYSMAFGALKLSMSLGGISAPVSKRSCSEKCSCKKSYGLDPKVDKLFCSYPL